MIDIVKHSSLLRYGKIYFRKKVVVQAPGPNEKSKVHSIYLGQCHETFYIRYLQMLASTTGAYLNAAFYGCSTPG